MAEENVAEYTAAAAGREAYEAYLEEEFLPVLLADADDMAEAMGGLLPPADRAAMDRGFTEWLTETFHRAGAQRIAGVLDDGQAAVRPWGFDVGVDHGAGRGLPGPAGRDGAVRARRVAGRARARAPRRTSPTTTATSRW